MPKSTRDIIIKIYARLLYIPHPKKICTYVGTYLLKLSACKVDVTKDKLKSWEVNDTDMSC